MTNEEEWFTLDDIHEFRSEDDLYCIAVESPERQFLIGEMGVPTHNTEEGKEEDSLKGEAQMIIGSIARLGRAAGVHLVLATQRPDASLIPGEVKANLGVRINCGWTNSTASSMILENGEGTRVKGNPKGRLYLGIHGKGNHGQGLFASPTWLDEYLESKGLNPDGTPLRKSKSKLVKLTNFDELAEGDLDTREGVDNESVINKIRQDEARGVYAEDSNDGSTPSGDTVGGRDNFDDDSHAEDFFNMEDDDDYDDDSTAAPHDDEERPQLLGTTTDGSKFDRPEDSWDDELEDLIKENFN